MGMVGGILEAGGYIASGFMKPAKPLDLGRIGDSAISDSLTSWSPR